MNKILLTERLNLSKRQVSRLQLVENTQRINGVQCIAAYKLAICKCDIENLNGRIYPRALWEKVIREGQGEGKPGLLDHPDGSSEPSIKDIFCTYHNLRIEGSTVYADAYLFGDNGRMIHEAIQSGDQIVGLSCVGYGNISSIDGKTVEDYSLERPADAVISPSGEIWASAADQISSGELHTESAKGFAEKLRQAKRKTANLSPAKQAVSEYLSEQFAAFPVLTEHRELLENAHNLQDVQRKLMRIKREVINV